VPRHSDVALPGAGEGTAVSELPLISVIDDDASLRSALVGLVRSLGHDALGFGSAEEFLQADAAKASDCIISDIQMPGMSGIELAQHLTMRNVFTPIILITARADPALKEKALASGAVCFLRKPFDGEVLIRCMENALEKQDGTDKT
jgi:FixJ family two-component response regulator